MSKRLTNEGLLEKIEQIVELKFSSREDKLLSEIENLKELNQNLIEANKSLTSPLEQFITAASTESPAPAAPAPVVNVPVDSSHDVPMNQKLVSLTSIYSFYLTACTVMSAYQLLNVP